MAVVNFYLTLQNSRTAIDNSLRKKDKNLREKDFVEEAGAMLLTSWCEAPLRTQYSKASGRPRNQIPARGLGIGGTKLGLRAIRWHGN